MRRQRARRGGPGAGAVGGGAHSGSAGWKAGLPTGKGGPQRAAEVGRSAAEMLPGCRPIALGDAAVPQAEIFLLRGHCFPFPAQAKREMVLRIHFDFQVTITPPCSRVGSTQVWGSGGLLVSMGRRPREPPSAISPSIGAGSLC